MKKVWFAAALLVPFVAVACRSSVRGPQPKRGDTPVVANAPPVPTGGVARSPWPETTMSASRVKCREPEKCVRLPWAYDHARGELEEIATDERFGEVVGVETIGEHTLAEIRFAGTLAGTPYESSVMAEPGRVIPSPGGDAVIADVRVVGPQYHTDPREVHADREWWADAWLAPVEGTFSRPSARMLLTRGGRLGAWSVHLDELRTSGAGAQARVTVSSGEKAMRFWVGEGTVFELDGKRFMVDRVAPMVFGEAAVGWIEIVAG